MADCDFMQICRVLKRRSDVIGELQKVGTHCLRSLMQMTPLGAFGPGIKIKTILMHFKKQAAVTLHRAHAPLKCSWQSTTETYVDCVFSLDRLAG